MIDDVTTTIRAPKALLDRLEVLARQNGGMRTRSDVIRWALTRGVDALEADLQLGGSPPVPRPDLASEVAQLRARLDAIARRL